jgi:hypothetical protein
MAAQAPNGNGYSRYAFYVSLVAAMFGIMGGIVAVIFWVGGIANEVTQNRDVMAAQAEQIKTLQYDLRQNDLLTSNLQRDEREIESQFCASDIVRNLMHANDLRQISLLWKKQFHDEYPISNAYYPQICQRPTTSQ